jgi:hypothetical protein
VVPPYSNQGCAAYGIWPHDDGLPPPPDDPFWATPFIPFNQDVTVGNGRSLVLSNSPETLRNNFGLTEHLLQPEPINLYKAEMPLNANIPRRFRLWFWHVNALSVPIFSGIVAFVTAGTAVIRRRHDHIDFATAGTGNLSGPGRCLAIRQLARDLNPQQDLPLGNTGVSVWGQQQIPANRLFCGMIEFDVRATQSCLLRLRFYATRQSNLIGGWNTRVWDPANAFDLANGTDHIRGWWEHSNFEARHSTDVFDLMDTTPGMDDDDWRNYEIVSQAGIHVVGPNAPFGGGRAADPFGSPGGNKGLYGVDLFYHIRIMNSAGMPRTLQSRIAARNSGHFDQAAEVHRRGRFWGAADIGGLPLHQNMCGIPTLHYLGPRNQNQNLEPINHTWRWFCLLNNLTISANSPPGFVTYHLVTGGAANLPAALLLSRPTLPQNEEEEGDAS